MKRLHVLCGGIAAVALGIFALAGPASAHVTVVAPDATQGGDAVLTIRVPTESATASTIALRVQLPTDTPIASVAVQPHPGWSFTTKTVKLAAPIKTDDGDVTEAVSEIDWKADSAATAIKPGEFDEFNVSAGPLPMTDTLTLRAIQVYSDGSQVAWNETPAPGSTTEPDHPAPSVTLAKAGASAAAPTAAATATAVAAKSASNTGPVTLSIIALVLAAAALSIATVTRAKLKGQRG
ncbi:MAG: hypothetical protein QOE97_3368 [Pseudonocardiales bacterium]|nr:hypothetical protein [Pseudonocardiales bacterium]